MLRLLAGFEAPSSGRLLIDGQDLASIPPYRRPVNMMFQSYALFPHMTVERNVAFGLEQEALSKREIARRVGEKLADIRVREALCRVEATEIRSSSGLPPLEDLDAPARPDPQAA